MNPPVKAFHRDVLASKTTHGLLQPFDQTKFQPLILISFSRFFMNNSIFLIEGKSKKSDISLIDVKGEQRPKKRAQNKNKNVSSYLLNIFQTIVTAF